MKQGLEKILKRDNGDRVKITISMSLYLRADGFEYDHRIQVCAKRKRIWKPVYDGNDYVFRGMRQIAKAEHIKQRELEHVTAEEIYAAKLELWLSLEPVHER
jgi:hypothetical protein